MKPPTVLQILAAFFAILASCLAAVAPPEFVPGTLRETSRQTAARYTIKDCDATRSSTCTDCGKIKLCLSTDDTKNPIQDCPANIPYCSMSTTVTGAVCQKIPDPTVAECAPAKSTFTCTGVGFYPNLKSCQLYHYCSALGAVADDYECPGGYRFSSKANGCALSSVACPTFTCKLDNPDAVYQAYPADTQYYVYCSYDRTKSPPSFLGAYVLSCGQGAAYNPATDRCVFTCPKEGLFVDSANPRQYYQCYYLNGALVPRDMVCAATQKFSPADNRCV
ncbi:uncharacterized protein LOC120414933 [Culex pipiens pallens]|uniref:uncharacterized protein LOC120414933 n=1 Tax=Culex pipiens pallens TaxID=42434 RepID=UPI001954E51D|nr:uncharacterized protein LOC120414933 [Culex pipiens pallens]